MVLELMIVYELGMDVAFWLDFFCLIISTFCLKV